MHITAKSTFDKETVTMLCRVTFFGKHKMSVRVGLMSAICAAFAMLSIYAYVNFGFEFSNMLLAIASAFVYLLFLFISFVMPKLQIKNLEKMKIMGCKAHYTLSEELIEASTDAPARQAGEALRYECISRVTETDKYLFLFQANNTAYIIEKATICGGTVSEITEKLQGIGAKYVRCKY